MNGRTDRLFRTAAWLYVVPRTAKGLLILALAVLAGFMVLTALALDLLPRIGR